MTSPPWNLHDSLVRAVFGAPDNMAAELRAVLPSELCAELDFESLQHRPGHFVDPDMRHAETDLLFSVRMGAERALVYVLVEHQSGPDRWMALRLLRYIGRVLDAQRAEAPSEGLPLVLPVVLHHGEALWPFGRALSDLYSSPVPPAARPYVVDFTFWLDDLTSVPGIALASRPASAVARFTWVILKCARRPNDLLPYLAEVGLHFADLQDDQVVDTQRSALMVYIGTVVGEEPTRRFARQQGGPQLEEAVMNDFQRALEAKWNEGRAEGKAESLLNLLQLKFRRVPSEVEARIRAATIREQDAWMARVLTARTLDGVFEE